MIGLAADRNAEPRNDSGGNHRTDESNVPHSANRGLWDGAEAQMIMMGGCLLPTVTITAAALLGAEPLLRIALKHPVETALEAALVCAVPAATFLVHRALRVGDKRQHVQLGILNGTAIGTTLAIAGIGLASLWSPANAHSLLALLISSVSIIAGLVSGHLAFELRACAETHASQTKRLRHTACGIALSLLVLVAAEGRGTAVRISEYLALSPTARDHTAGINWLRRLGCEQDLRMQCADERTAGVPGLFYRIAPQKEKQIYFEAVGKPYSNALTDSVYAMSDDFLKHNVVGDLVPDLSLVRSSMTGNVNAQILTGTVDWTFVFKNTGFADKEARAEIALPPSAVVSGLTLWVEGEERQATFGASEIVATTGATANAGPSNDDANHPVMVTDLGRGRVLLHCAAIPSQGEQKVRLRVTEPLRLQNLESATLALPSFVATNFDLAGSHQLRIHSQAPLSVPADRTFRVVDTADGGKLIEGQLTSEDLHSKAIVVKAARAPEVGPFALSDGQTGSCVIEHIEPRVAAAPKNLVIVVDGSGSMAAEKDNIKKALGELPRTVNATVILAAEGQQPEPLPLVEALARLDKLNFDGGHNNLESVIKAAEEAGDTANGAVLWIHGPQPSFSDEMYIMAPYIAKPQFFELALDGGYTDTSEFFRNHHEIGPFQPVPRCASPGEDLKQFIGKWQPGSVDYTVVYSASTSTNGARLLVDSSAGNALASLLAAQRVKELTALRQTNQAAVLAAHANIVTPLTAAVMTGAEPAQPQTPVATQTQTADNKPAFDFGLQQNFTATVSQLNSLNVYTAATAATAPEAGDGTTTSQNADSSLISGVNTAGTVRVNNLANLEALLNLIANAMEILGVGYAIYAFFDGIVLAPRGTGKFNGRRLAWGCAALVIGLGVPGWVNWLMASARDANLFS